MGRGYSRHSKSQREIGRRVIRGRLRYPTYYPSRADAARLLRRTGLRVRVLRSWTEPLAEKTPGAIVAFTRAFSEPGLRAVLPADDVERFYRRLLEDLRLRKPSIRWRRILVAAEKGASGIS